MSDWDRFIADNTRFSEPPLLPEIRIAMTDRSLPMWEATEEFLSRGPIEPPFWAFAWPGGQALARYIIDHPQVVRGKSVLDLGAGSGLVGIACAKSGASTVVASDIDALAARAIQLNAKANDVAIVTDESDRLGGDTSGFDVLLVGDLFYERGLADRVLAFAQAAARAGVLVLAGDPERNYFPQAHFTSVAVYDVPVTLDLEDSTSKRTQVWRLLPH